MGFYDKLNTVQWDQLYHSYGPAGDVPDLLRDLTSPVKKIRDDARSSLLYSLDHQGVQRWESTAAATPFLLDLLQDPLVADRHLLIPLLTDFAIGSADGYYIYTGFHIDEVCRPEGTKEYGYFVFQERQGSPEDLTYGKLLRSIYQEVRKGLPIYLKLIGDKSKRMRVFAVQILGWLTDAADQIVPPLTAQLQREKHSLARASQALALSYVTTFDSTLRAGVRSILEAAFAKAESAVERRLVGIALLRAGGSLDPLRSVLMAALRQPPAKPQSYRQFPWAAFEQTSVLMELLFRYAPEVWHSDIAEAACDGLRHSTDRHDVLDLVTNLVRRLFPALPPDRQPQWYDAYRPVALEDLNDVQRRVLRALVETPLTWHFGNMQLLLNEFGLPVYADRMQKFLDGEGDVMRFRYREEHLMPASFFERLKAIMWREQQHRYGSADDLPDMLRALLAPDASTRRSAHQKLTSSLAMAYPGEGRKEVSLLVTPLLLEMLVHPDVQERHLLLALLADIAVDGARSPRQWGYQSEYHYFLHGFNIEHNTSTQGSLERGWQVFRSGTGDHEVGGAEDLAYGKRARSIYDEVRKGLPQILSFTDHAEASMRVFAAFALAWFTTDQAQIVPRLSAQFRIESDRLARASQALALAYVSMDAPELQALWRRNVEVALGHAEDGLERRMLATALLRGGSTFEAVKSTLCAALRQPDAVWSDFERWPWARLEDNNVLLDLLLHLAPTLWQGEILEAACAYLSACSAKNEKDRAEDAAETLLRYFFRELDTEERFGVGDGANAPAIKLDVSQRRILQSIVEADTFWETDGYPHLPLLGYGVPGYRDQVRVLLGA